MGENKVCVYAICKNESKFIPRWLDSIQDADYIVVLDTGSTDGSYDMLKNDSRVTLVKKKIIKPWRFDVARNEAMSLVPADANILFSLDIDEIVEPGWVKVLKDNWQENDDRCHYRYAWSHDGAGNPTDVFVYDKIHTRDYHWIWPVHEVLYPNTEKESENVFDAGESIYVHHLPDTTKSRSSYFELLKLSVKENPDNAHCKMLLAREYLINNDFDEALKQYTECLGVADINDPKNRLVLNETLSRIADINFHNRNYDEALHYYRECLLRDQTRREPYICMGELYNEIGLYGLAKATVEQAMKYCTRYYDWTERKQTWTCACEDVLSVSCYYLHEYDEALKYIKVVAACNPEDPRILKNYNAILLAKYEDTFTENYVYGS